MNRYRQLAQNNAYDVSSDNAYDSRQKKTNIAKTTCHSFSGAVSTGDMANFCIEEEEECNNRKHVGEQDEEMLSMLSQLKHEGAFCSKYIVKALQYAGVYGFHELDANKSSPSSLYHRIMEPDYQIMFGGLVTAAPPFRQRLLEKQAKLHA